MKNFNLKIELICFLSVQVGLIQPVFPKVPKKGTKFNPGG